MKATVSVFGGRVSFEMEAESQKALFKKLAMVQEIFAADDSCGCCNGQNIIYRTRNWEGYDYYELHCQDCHAELKFGQRREGGGLFPKRKDDQTMEWLPNRGWSIYQGTNGNGHQDYEDTRPQAAQPRQAAPPPRNGGNGRPVAPPPNRREPTPQADHISDDDVPF